MLVPNKKSYQGMDSYKFRMKLAIFEFFVHGAGQLGVTNFFVQKLFS